MFPATATSWLVRSTATIHIFVIADRTDGSRDGEGLRRNRMFSWVSGGLTCRLACWLSCGLTSRLACRLTSRLARRLTCWFSCRGRAVCWIDKDT